MAEITDEDFLIVIDYLEGQMQSRADEIAINLEQWVRSRKAAGLTAQEIVNEAYDPERGVLSRIRNSFGLGVKQNIEHTSQRTRDVLYERELGEDKLFRWVLTKENNCDDCVSRSHEGYATYAEWRARGLPGSGTTICGPNCGCWLEPKGAKAETDYRREPIETQPGTISDQAGNIIPPRDRQPEIPNTQGE